MSQTFTFKFILVRYVFSQHTYFLWALPGKMLVSQSKPNHDRTSTSVEVGFEMKMTLQSTPQTFYRIEPWGSLEKHLMSTTTIQQQWHQKQERQQKTLSTKKITAMVASRSVK